MKVDCPKCLSPNARYEKTATDLILVCFCGLRKLVFTTLDDFNVQHNDRPEDIRLPGRETKLYKTLVCLAAIEPANSREVTDTLVFQGYDFNVSDVSSYLMMLQGKGLTSVLQSRRGVPGGSTWGLTDSAERLLGL